jgi:hypothetical protein
MLAHTRVGIESASAVATTTRSNGNDVRRLITVVQAARILPLARLLRYDFCLRRLPRALKLSRISFWN